MVIHSDFNKLMSTCLQGGTLNSFDVVSMHEFGGFVPLYFIDDFTEDSQFLLVDQLDYVDLSLLDVLYVGSFSVSHGSFLSLL